MDLGSALTVLIASRLGIPRSTTQCIVGAALAIGLCNGHYKGINWRIVGWCYLGWIVALPATALVSSILLSVIFNAHWELRSKARSDGRCVYYCIDRTEHQLAWF
jgi:solute carrier family 20 (sodium-dependent phosphate transporter)